VRLVIIRIQWSSGSWHRCRNF